MGRIILTIAGPWTEVPMVETPFELTLEPANANFNEDFMDLARGMEGVSPQELKAVRDHQSLISVEATFEAPGKTKHAQDAALLIRNLVARGATGVLVDTAMKVFTARDLEGFVPQSTQMLFHLFVEIIGDEHTISTEGMQAFDLPEVRVNYTAANKEAAQAAAFGMAARMVCERFKPAHGGVYRNSESAPLYDVVKLPPDGDPTDLFVNPHGMWELTIDI